MTVTPAEAQVGQPLTISVTIKNETAKNLTDVAVVSHKAPDCSRPDLGTLAPHQSVTYSCSGGKAQDPPVTFDLAATATVGGAGYYGKDLRTVTKAKYTVTGTPTPSPSLPVTGSTAASGLAAVGLGLVVLGVLALFVSVTWRMRLRER